MNTQKLTLIALAVSSAFSATAVSAKTEKALDEEKIIVTASRYQRSVDEVLASVAVIDRAEIEKIQPLSIADLLQTVAGIDIARQGGQGQVASSFTRGTNSSHTLILVDGVRIGSATLGAPSLATIPTDQIERVEIVKGPRASMYGSDAIGGVIQIFTRRLSGGEFGVSAEFGSDKYKKASALAGITHGDGSTTVSLSAEESDGFDVYKLVEDDDDGYDRINLAVNGEQQLSEHWRLGWVGRYDEGNTEFDDTFGGEYINELEFKNHILQSTLSYRDANWQHDIMLAQSRDSSVSFGTNLPIEDAGRFDTRRHQLSYVGHYLVSEQLNLTMGGEYYRDDITTKDEYTQDSRDVYGVFAGATYQRDAMIAEASVRHDDVEKIDSETTYNVSAGYQFSEDFFAGFNIGTGFKAPTFNDLYYPWGGNPDLVSENSDSYEFLFRGNFAGIKTEASIYQTEIDDLIEWAPLDGNAFIWTPQNIASAEIDGAEISFSKTLDALSASVFYSYVDAKNADTGERLNRRARHTANMALSYALNDWLLAANYGYHGSRFDQGTKLENYSVLDLSVTYDIDSHWQMQLKANNVFDEDYQTVNNYVAPGSQYFIKVTYKNF